MESFVKFSNQFLEFYTHDFHKILLEHSLYSTEMMMIELLECTEAVSLEDSSRKRKLDN